MPSTRRTALASAGTTFVALAGCTTVQDALRPSPDRVVPPDWQPPPGTWPAPAYGPANTGHSPDATPPRRPPEPAWTEPVTDAVSSLVVGPEHVYVATSHGVVALDADDGTRRWTRDVGDTNRLQYVDGRLYEIGSEAVRARTPAGEPVWETALPSWPVSLHERSGYVFVGRQGGYSTLHADTGEVVRNRGAWVGPMAVRGDAAYGAGAHEVGGYAVGSRTLQERWRVSLDGPYHAYSVPVLGDGTLYQPEYAMAGSDAPDGRLSPYGLDGTSHAKTSFAQVPMGVVVTDDAAFVGTTTITASDIGEAGRLLALDRHGGRRWDVGIDAGFTAPVVAHGVVLAGPFARSTVPLLAVDAATGDELWKRDVSGTARIALAGDRVYVGHDDRVEALRP